MTGYDRVWSHRVVRLWLAHRHGSMEPLEYCLEYSWVLLYRALCGAGSILRRCLAARSGAKLSLLTLHSISNISTWLQLRFVRGYTFVVLAASNGVHPEAEARPAYMTNPRCTKSTRYTHWSTISYTSMLSTVINGGHCSATTGCDGQRSAMSQLILYKRRQECVINPTQSSLQLYLATSHLDAYGSRTLRSGRAAFSTRSEVCGHRRVHQHGRDSSQ